MLSRDFISWIDANSEGKADAPATMDQVQKLAYLCQRLAEEVECINRAYRVTANTVGCLANGIKPD